MELIKKNKKLGSETERDRQKGRQIDNGEDMNIINVKFVQSNCTTNIHNTHLHFLILPILFVFVFVFVFFFSLCAKTAFVTGFWAFILFLISSRCVGRTASWLHALSLSPSWLSYYETFFIKKKKIFELKDKLMEV